MVLRRLLTGLISIKCSRQKLRLYDQQYVLRCEDHRSMLLYGVRSMQSGTAVARANSFECYRVLVKTLNYSFETSAIFIKNAALFSNVGSLDACIFAVCASFRITRR